MDIKSNNNHQCPQQVLSQVFGYETFKPLQKLIIDSLIAGKNNFVLMPTGGGKSLCYQIPALIRDGVGIVISPLIALMQDQVNALVSNGARAAYYNSSLSSEESRAVLAQLHQNKLDLLYIAPERLLNPAFLERLKEINIAIFAIDEAHCISQWGPDFRPEYLQLGKLRDFFPQVPLIALTATADKQTRKDIREKLFLQNAEFHLASFNRPNIYYSVLEKHQPFKQLLHFVNQQNHQSGIIYCMTRKRVEEISEKLREQNISAKAYHAGLSANTRKNVQDAFQKDDIQIVVATIAFGMGIDKSNVRFVVHYDLPKTIESYYQETGRAGRDSLPSQALLLYGLNDVVIAKTIIEKNNNANHQRIEMQKLNSMIGFAEAQTCRRRVLLNYFDEQYEKDCQNCDVCLNPPQMYDATIDAQKALSCVYRVQQRFGITHVVQVLRGLENKRILSLKHNELNVYGLGKHLSEEEWFSIFRQLIHRGFIEQDIANYSVLKLNPRAKSLLRGEEQLYLAKPRIKNPEKKDKIKEEKNSPVNYDADLFLTLRVVRKNLADEMNVPPFIIFSDASLYEMAQKKPTTHAAFLQISGVGEYKLKQYGEEFIQVIKKHIP